MRIGFFVNAIEAEQSIYTTTRLAFEARRRGHDVWYADAEDMTTLPDSSVIAHAVRVPDKAFRSAETLLAAVQRTEPKTLELEGLDVFWLRSDPAAEAKRPWAAQVGIDFGLLLAERGVTVLNDPAGLTRAAHKMYVQRMPEWVRPRTVVTRELEEVRTFLDREGTDVILKPLHGSGGDRVFLIRENDGANLRQIFEAVAQSGYVIVQEYLPAAAEGDVRMFLLNGRPLQVDGRYAAVRRVAAEGELRNNVSRGGTPEALEMTAELLAVAEAVRPRLVEDGMFLVGLDIAGHRILEVNVYSPGGLGTCEHFEQVDFTGAVIDAVEAKESVIRAYGRRFSNTRLATL